MNFKLLILLCALSAALAFPYEHDYETAIREVHYEDNLDTPNELPRFKRQWVGGGGGSPGKGFDFSVDGHVPVWQSSNRRHEIGANVGYSQHLGGPYGNSRPDIRGGATYTFRF